MPTPLPDWALECIPWGALTRPDRRKLERVVAKHKSFEAVMAHWPAQLAEWIDEIGRLYIEHLSSVPSESDPDLDGAVAHEISALALVRELITLGQNPAAIDAWLAKHHLLEVAAMSMRELCREFGEYSWYSGTVRTALLDRHGARDAHDMLYSVLLNWNETREERRKQLAQWHTPTAPELRAAQQTCLEALDTNQIYLSQALNCQLQEDPPALTHDHVTLDLEHGTARRMNATAARGFLELLTSPKKAQVRLREQLVETIRMPRTARDLRALTARLTGHTPPADTGEQFGWMLKDSKNTWTVEPVRLTPKVRGGGYKTKLLKRGEATPPRRPIDDLVDSRSTLIGMLDELREHPLVLVRSGGSCDGLPRRVRRTELQLGIRHSDEGATVQIELNGQPLSPETLSGPGRVHRNWFITITPTEILVAPLSEVMVSVHGLMSLRGGLVLPDGASLLHELPWLTERVGVEADRDTLGESVPTDDRPVLRFSLDGQTLHLSARVQPLPEAPSHPPGRGSALVVGQRAGTTVHAQRVLAREPAHVRQVISSLPLSDALEEPPFQWRIEGLQGALELVEAARALADTVRVQWGGERPILASRRLESSDLSMRVSSQRDWFGLDGEVTVDGQSVPLGALLDAALEGHAWVPLSSGQWVRISEGMRKHLSAAAVAGGRKGTETALQAVHAPLLEPLLEDGAALDAPVAWTDLAGRCREAAALEPPLPRSLKATLRPYQLDGVRWLLQLAHWAPGAVLADDMGLGKTVQTIALLLDRAAEPALVVAPTSLLHNWQRELERFAPSLDVQVYHGAGRSLEPAAGRVVLTTYGVLVNDVDALKATRFGTVVFDEAHALKNPSARRSTAARTLDTAFVVGLTGTPVENRVAELWSLFRVVVPGLLGTAASFRQRFVLPIEGNGDLTRRTTLARLVAPFLLRRTKRQVATDLPERTELTRQVQLSPAERTLYDRTRLASLARLEGAGSGKRMQILQELLRLRMLACHPKLVDATSTVESSKLKTVRRLVADFRDADQRILLFSTFTTHLALIREALVADGHQVQYLDGSMSPRQRTAAVDAFQAGEGDVFLISTKAGGVGLNLTAASAVIHVDPWWNPASEDQATDRAHRIGQRQPVTVVRVVAAQTIEEQIVALHATKRDLAEALLAHSGSSAPVGLDELLGLLSASIDGEPTPQEPPPSMPVQAPAPALAGPVASAGVRPLLDAFEGHMEQARASGDIRSENTVRSYTRAIRNFLDWHDGALTRDALADAGDRYVAAAKSGAVPHKSDKVYAKPAIARFLAQLGTPEP